MDESLVAGTLIWLNKEVLLPRNCPYDSLKSSYMNLCEYGDGLLLGHADDPGRDWGSEDVA